MFRRIRKNRLTCVVVVVVVVTFIAGMSSSFECRSSTIRSSKLYSGDTNQNQLRSCLTRHRRTTNWPFVVGHFATPSTKSLTEMSTKSSSSSSCLDDATDDNLPFFASPVSTNPSQISIIDEKISQNQAAKKTQEQDRMLTRRSAFRYGAILTVSSLLTGTVFTKTNRFAQEPPQKRITFIPEPILKPINIKELQQRSEATKTKAISSSRPQSKNLVESATTTETKPIITAAIPDTGRLEAINLTQVVSETNINVTMNCNKGCISIDSNNFTFNKVEKPNVPKWFPSFLTPSPQVVKKMSNNELLVAATVAGSITEMGRTLLLYPLQTIKTRVQADKNRGNGVDNEIEGDFTSLPLPFASLSEQVTTIGVNIQNKINEGDLYAGISPTLLISVPSTGIYYGVRDVTKRMLYMTPLSPTFISLLGATVGDVISLCFRTPSETLAIRLQNNNETVGNWLGDSFARLPIVIVTDLPYLVSKIVLNRSLIQGSISMSNYAQYAVLAAVVAGFLSTPFDVVRTRILLEKQLVVSNEDEDDVGVLQTMIQITKEGDGGIKNLYAGWIERVLYLGIGRAWLEPIQLISYIGIRDSVLLEWF